MKVKVALILALLLTTLCTNKKTIRDYDLFKKNDLNESTDTIDTLDLNNSNDKSINDSLLFKQTKNNYIDELFEQDSFYEIEEKVKYKELQSNYYLKENYKITTAINDLYTLSCKEAFKKWLEIFNNTEKISVKNSKNEFKKKLNIFCNNFELIVKNRFNYFKEYQTKNHLNMNLLRLTPFSWLTNEEFHKFYLSNSIKSKNNRQKKLKKKKISLSINNNYNKIFKKSYNKKFKRISQNSEPFKYNYYANFTDIVFNLSNKDFEQYFNTKQSYIVKKIENNVPTYEMSDDKIPQPLVTKKLLEIEIKNYPINVKDSIDYSSYLGDVEYQNKTDCWAYASMVLARAYNNIYFSYKSDNLRMSYSRIVDCYDDGKIIKGIPFNKVFNNMMVYGFSFENNYPNNYKERSNIRHKCVSYNHKPNIEFNEMINANSVESANDYYFTSTLKVDAAMKALEYGPYYSFIYMWPGIGNCEVCNNPPYCYDINHAVIVYKISNGLVYYRNSWGEEWGINGNGAIKAEYSLKSTIFPRKACNLLDYVNIPSFIRLYNR